MAAVRGLIDAVAGETPGEHLRNGVASQAVRDETVRPVRHRDDEVGAPTGAIALKQRSENLGDRAESARRKVSDLDRRPRGRRVPERAGPAKVVEVVACALFMPAAEAEAGDRAVDGAFGDVFRADAESGGYPGAKRLEHDVGLAHEFECGCGVELQIDLDRLFPRAERCVPGGGVAADRIAAWRPDADDARPEFQELAGREGSGEVPAEVDDQRPAQRLHPVRT